MRAEKSCSRRKCMDILSEVMKYFVADTSLLTIVLCGLISGSHILFEDNPGLGKTLLVKLLSKITGCNWRRIQFTPDLLPADIVGTKVWKAQQSTFQLERGPIFTNLLLADEINRAMPKTQSALLEAMEERQVTIEGETHPLARPFIVMATQNPIESEGTYPLPEAQLDRFTMRLSMGYVQTLEEEIEIISRRIAWRRNIPVPDTIIDQRELVELQQKVEDIYVHDNIRRYIAELVRATRSSDQVRVGASPRGSLALLRLSRALALIEGQEFVIPDYIKLMAPHALGHRLVLDMDYALEGGTSETVIREILETTSIPVNFEPGRWGHAPASTYSENR